MTNAPPYANHRNAINRPPPPPPAPAGQAVAGGGDIDDLARQLERLQLNVAQMRRDQRQGAAAAYHMGAINVLDPLYPSDDRTVPLMNADVLAESKGREMALKACRSLSVDALREAGLVIPDR